LVAGSIPVSRSSMEARQSRDYCVRKMRERFARRA
jgi:hypothetical protein